MYESHSSQSLSTEQMMHLHYDELRMIAKEALRHERRDHTLQATALVHEVYIRLTRERKHQWPEVSQFFGVSKLYIRRILLNWARDKAAIKRTPTMQSVQHRCKFKHEQRHSSLEVADAIEKLMQIRPRQGQVASMKVLSNLTSSEIARALSVSPRTIDGVWASARQWLRDEIHE